jgi:hypothetical protein
MIDVGWEREPCNVMHRVAITGKPWKHEAGAKRQEHDIGMERGGPGVRDK